MNSKRISGTRATATILIFAMAVLIVIPFAWMILSSFKTLGDIYKVPFELFSKNMTLDNYKTVLGRDDPPFMRYVLNSVIVAALSCTAQVLTSAVAGYAFAKYHFRGKNILFMLVLGTMMIPFQVIMVPQFLMFKAIGIYDSLWSLILPKLTTPLGIFLMRQYFSKIPDEIIESARVDGASEFQIFTKMMLPLAKPIVATLSVLTFIWKWNEYEQPLIFLNDKDKFTLPLGLLSFVDDAGVSQDNLILAASVLSLIPMLIVYGLCQKYIISGLTAGSVKG